MGEVDLENLFKIYYEINAIKKKHKLNFFFKIDHGSYETAIEFVGINHFHPPISQDWSKDPTIFCPDLLDYNNKIIIEFEEEVGEPRSGAKLAKKGHNREGDPTNKRDSRRNRYYKQAGFRLFQTWKSDPDWRPKLEKFLLDMSINKY
jgi:hypothetical protein